MTLAVTAVPDARSMTSRLFAVLGAFTEAAPGRSLSLTEIARHAGLPISTTHRLVGELVRCDALDRRRDGRYTIGFRLWEIGAQTPASQMLRTAALPYLEDLHGLAGDDVMLAVLDTDEIVCVESLVGHATDRGVRPTRRAPASGTAAGLVLLAHAGELGMRARARHRDPDPLQRRRETEARLEGVARIAGQGTISVAAPIRNRDREVVAAVAVSYAGDRAALRAYDDVVRMAARGISRALGYEGAQRRATA